MYKVQAQDDIETFGLPYITEDFEDAQRHARAAAIQILEEYQRSEEPGARHGLMYELTDRRWEIQLGDQESRFVEIVDTLN